MELEGNVEDCAGFFCIAVPSALVSEFSCLETVLGEKTVILLFFFLPLNSTGNNFRYITSDISCAVSNNVLSGFCFSLRSARLPELLLVIGVCG